MRLRLIVADGFDRRVIGDGLEAKGGEIVHRCVLRMFLRRWETDSNATEVFDL
jgi:hypothetical protein